MVLIIGGLFQLCTMQIIFVFPFKGFLSLSRCSTGVAFKLAGKTALRNAESKLYFSFIWNLVAKF